MNANVAATIVIVDDDPGIRQMLKELFKRSSPHPWPLELVEYGTGDDAVNGLLERHRHGQGVDLLILDMWMPRKVGGQGTKQTGRELNLLLCNKSFQIIPPHAPIVIFTGHENYEDANQCLRDGAHYYLPKTESGQNNTERLVKLCRQLLYPDAVVDPRQIWLNDHWKWLFDTYPGEHVAVCEGNLEHAVRTAIARDETLRCQMHDGYVLVAARESRPLGIMMVSSPILRWTTPCIIWVPTELSSTLR